MWNNFAWTSFKTTICIWFITKSKTEPWWCLRMNRILRNKFFLFYLLVKHYQPTRSDDQMLEYFYRLSKKDKEINWKNVHEILPLFYFDLKRIFLEKKTIDFSTLTLNILFLTLTWVLDKQKCFFFRLNVFIYKYTPFFFLLTHLIMWLIW